MTDPFQNVDAFGSNFLGVVINALENRAAEDQIVPVIERYLDDLNWNQKALHIEVGAGSGAIARRMAGRAGSGSVIGIDPSEGLINSAKELGKDVSNLEFEVGDGSALRFPDNSIESVVMHTVLSHVPSPEALLVEALRVLKPGGKVVICDADFEKSSLGNFEGDPLNSCAEYFVRNFVTHPYLISNIRKITQSVGLAIEDFRIDSRSITTTDAGLVWIMMGCNQMVEQGLIGEELSKSLTEEYKRRRDSGTLYGHQPFGTLIASKPK